MDASLPAQLVPVTGSTVTLDFCLVLSDCNGQSWKALRYLAVKIQVYLSNMLGLFTQRFFRTILYRDYGSLI